MPTTRQTPPTSLALRALVLAVLSTTASCGGVEDADGDTVPAEADCDDLDAALGDVALDQDCDGTLTALDCDDDDASLLAIADDADCDGMLTPDDCDDTNASSTYIAVDADCDGALTEDDCDDVDDTLGDIASDADCDGVDQALDCDDDDDRLGDRTHDADCNGALDASQACPMPVLDLLGRYDFDGTKTSYVDMDTSVQFTSVFGFAGWVRVNRWTGNYNRVFDFGNADQGQAMRLHRNRDETLRVAFNDWDLLDFPGYWTAKKTWIFVAVSVSDAGVHTVFKDGDLFDSAKGGGAPSGIVWPKDTNYWVGRSNWYGKEPNSDMSVADLRWFNRELDEACVEELMAITPE